MNRLHAWIFDIEAGAIQRTQRLHPVPSDVALSLPASMVVAENPRLVRRLFNLGLLFAIEIGLKRVTGEPKIPKNDI